MSDMKRYSRRDEMAKTVAGGRFFQEKSVTAMRKALKIKEYSVL